MPDETGSFTETILQASAHQIGGAGRVMMDLHAEYLRRGLDSWVAAGDVRRPGPGVVEVPNEALRSGWTRMLARLAGSGTRQEGGAGALAKALLVASDPRRYLAILSGVEDFAFPGTRALLQLPARRPDVLHLHNLHGYYFDLRALPEISWQVPTMVTMHDAWLLTGHCAHPFDCGRWMTGCGECPDLDMYVPIRADATARNRQLKRDLVQRSRLGLVSPSRWLLKMAEDTLPLGDDLVTRLIPNGVDVAVFHPGDRREARRLLGLPPDAPMLLATAEMLADNPFKDFATLRAALSHVGSRPEGETLLVALGLEREVEPIKGVRVVAVPFVDDAERVALHYRAADVYVHAAIAENLPLTIIEAMACGTPVVASDVGGVGELVEHGVTGLLVPARDSMALADAVTSLLGDEALGDRLGRAGADRVLERFTLEREADAYLGWYAELRDAWGTAVV